MACFGCTLATLHRVTLAASQKKTTASFRDYTPCQLHLEALALACTHFPTRNRGKVGEVLLGLAAARLSEFPAMWIGLNNLLNN